jgi:hypothetical protein
MLFKMAVLEKVAAGTVSCAFRRWKKPTVIAGSQLRTAIGVLDIISVDRVSRTSLTEADATRAGYETLAALLRDLDARDEGDIYKVAFKRGGADPRIALRSNAKLTKDERAEIAAKLARLDAASRNGAWTAEALDLIAANPGVRAPDLAARAGRETLAFKRDIRKLKELGLTESLEVGYRLSPRGRAFLKS